MHVQEARERVPKSEQKYSGSGRFASTAWNPTFGDEMVAQEAPTGMSFRLDVRSAIS